MADRTIDGICTPTELEAKVPSLEGDDVLTRGGLDESDGGRKETANTMSGLPLLPDLYKTPEGPGESEVPWPSVDAQSRTIPFHLDRK